MFDRWKGRIYDVFQGIRVLGSGSCRCGPHVCRATSVQTASVSNAAGSWVVTVGSKQFRSFSC
jgi:hypothetical protein